MTNSNLISYQILPSGIGLINLGSPEEKVIILSQTRLENLEELLVKISKDLPKGLIITGNSETMFSAGADINVIQSINTATEGQALAKKGQDVFNLIEDLPIKTVAAISGPCVGGACELALACTHRVMSDNEKSSIGLPEVKIGILPGFGGTQRLPRIIGLEEALKIILPGNVINSWKAKKIALVDAVVSYQELIAKAESFITQVDNSLKAKMTFKNKLIIKLPFARKFIGEITKKDLLKKTHGHYPAPLKALECVLYGLAEGQKKGLINEAKGLGELIVTPECKALTNLFFLSENAKGIGKSAKDHIKNLSTLVIGAGTMGAGIAGEFARNKYPVILKDTKNEAVSAGLETIRKNLSFRKSLTEQDQAKILKHITPQTDYDQSISEVNFVVEAIFENLELKSKILEDIAMRIAPDAIIASNTSSLSISEIASNIPNPERVVGMHFFNPVPQLPLVEIVRGEKTNDQTICLVAALASKIGKFPIVVEDVPGFLVNRILTTYLNEAAFLLKEGYAIEDIDKAALNFGLPMGPIRLLDQIGLDVASHVSKTMASGYGKRMLAPNYTEKLLLTNRLGKKNSLGFYSYLAKTPTVDPKVYQILEITEKKTANPQQIQDRLILSLINEAVLCLDEGVAGTPGRDAARQIDLGTVMGTGFPAFRGGIIYYANSIGAAKLVHQMQNLERLVDSRFRPVTGILTRAEKGIGFYE